MRGDITSRRLKVLIDGLPEGSALHRARLDGHEWTSVHDLLWTLVQAVPRREKLLARQLNKQQAQGLKMPKLKTYPWDPDQDQSRYGKNNAGDEEAALSYLEGLSPS